MTSEQIAGGGDPAGTSLDTSWLHETSDPSGARRARGRGGPARSSFGTSWLPGTSDPSGGDRALPAGSRRRARRRTLSPSIGSKSFMSGVDFNDPENYPSIPRAGTSSSTLPVSSGASVVGIAAEEGGNAALISPTKRTAASPSPGSDELDDRLPDPSVIAGLFDVDGTPEPKLPSPPLGLLGSLENQACSVGTERDRFGEKGRGQGQGSAKSVKSSSRENDHISAEVENRQPGLDGPTVVAAPGTTGAVRATSSPSPVLTSTCRGAPSSTNAATASPAMDTAVTPGDGNGGEERALPPAPASESAQATAPPPPPPAVPKQKKSRNARRRSILMPSEAFATSDLGGNGVEVAPPPPKQNCPTGGDTNPPPTAATTADREGKPKRSSGKKSGGGGGGSGKGKTAAEALPLTSINATSCLARPLATQRGWQRGSGDSTKLLVRAYYAAGKGSQRARRVAARLFCLTGFCLLPVTPDDARVLCEAAGDTMEWGLEETDTPRLVSRALVRETREQKRELVRRIKPLFELMDNATQDERRAVEENTGVISRKAAPDGYCYEDRETKAPVDPDVYKAMYTKHIQATRAARLREWAALRPNTLAFAEVAAESSSGSGDSTLSAISASPSALPAKAARSTPDSAAALIPQPIPLEPERIGAARTLEATKTDEGREGAVASAGKPAAERPLANTALGASNEGASNPRAESEPVAAGQVVAVEEVGADGMRTPKASMPSKVGLEGSADRKGFATPTVVGGVEGGEGGEEVNRELKSPAAVPSPVDGGGGADAVNRVGRCSELGAGRALVVAGTVGNAEGLCSSAAGGCGVDWPAIDSDATTHALPALSPLDLELSRIEAVEANVSLVASAQEDDHVPGLEFSGISGKDLAVRSSSTSSPFAEESTAPPPPPKTAAAPISKTASPQHADLLHVGESRGDGSPSGDEQSPDGGAACAGDVQATTSPVVPSRDSNISSPKVLVRGDNGGGFREAPLAPVFLSPLAFPSRSSEDDNEESTCQAVGRGDAAQVLPSVEAFATLDASSVCDTGASEATLSPGVTADEAKEFAALEERLWAVWDAGLEEYHAGVALIKSRRNGQVLASVTSTSVLKVHEKTPTAVVGPVDAVAPPATTPNVAMMVATRSVSGGRRVSPASSCMRTVASPANNGSAIGSEAFSRRGGEASPSPTPQPPSTGRVGHVDVLTPLPPSTGRAGYVGALSPSSPRLPLLDLRLSEEEELFESRSLRMVVEGTRAVGATSRGARRRSPAWQFSAEKRCTAMKQQQKQKGGVVGSAGGAGGVAVDESGEGGGGEDSTCRLCCRKECDKILRPCQHVVCGTCVEKLRVQAEQTGEVLACPWDRQPVDEIDVNLTL